MKKADWIWIPFGVVSGVGPSIGVLDGAWGSHIARRGEGYGIWGFLSIALNGVLEFICKRECI